jgi:ATP-dependent Clp protease ATP-binding subunit ClpA
MKTIKYPETQTQNAMASSCSSAFLPPLCDKYGKDLTAKENIERSLLVSGEQVARLAMILAAQGHNNVVITGGAGTGKTTLVKAISTVIYSGKYPCLKGRRIVEINLDTLLKDCYSVADSGTRLKNLFDEAERENIIIFIDEGHRLYGSGESQSLGNIAKPFLTKDTLQVILATTKVEYRNFIECDVALKRRFEEINISEPEFDEMVKILKKISRVKYKGVTINNSVLEKIIEAGNRYFPGQYNPDKSIKLLEHAVSWGRMNSYNGELTDDITYAALSCELGIPEETMRSDMNAKMQNVSKNLSAKFPGWERSIKKLSRMLQESLTRKLRKSGPLCAVMLAGEDALLLEDVATEAAKEMGFVGKKQIRVISVPMIHNSINTKASGDPMVEPILNDPNTAMIFSNILTPSLTKEIISKLADVVQEGKLKDSAGRLADYKNAPIFLICADNTGWPKMIGFGREAADVQIKASYTATELATTIFGHDTDNVIVFGAPDKEKSHAIVDEIFEPTLKKSAKK